MIAATNINRGLLVYLAVVLIAQGTHNSNLCQGDVGVALFNRAYEVVATTPASSSKVTDSALIDAFRGGHSSDLYPYVLWRNVKGRPQANIEIVFFNEKGVGIVFPACAQPTDGGFILQLRQKSAGEFGHVSEIHDINFQTSVPTGIMKVDLVTTRKHSELVFFKKTEIEKYRFELHPRNLSSDIMTRALSLQTRLRYGPGT